MKALEWLNLISSLYNFFYSAALALAMLFSLPYWIFQMLRHGKYRRGLGERLGRCRRACSCRDGQNRRYGCMPSP